MIACNRVWLSKGFWNVAPSEFSPAVADISSKSRRHSATAGFVNILLATVMQQSMKFKVTVPAAFWTIVFKLFLYASATAFAVTLDSGDVCLMRSINRTTSRNRW